MGYPPDFDEPLPDIYRSREAFFASLPAWRRFLAKFNWHPTIDLMVQRYAREQEAARRQDIEDRLAKAESSPVGDALLADLDAELNRRGSTRTTITDLPAEPTAPRPPDRGCRSLSFRQAVASPMQARGLDGASPSPA